MHEISSWDNRRNAIYPLKASDIPTISRNIDFSVNINESDMFSKEMSFYFGLMKIMVVHHTSTNENTGKFVYSFWTPRTIYFILHYSLFLYCFSFNITRNFGMPKHLTSFDESVLLHQFYIYSIVIILPLITLLESRKVTDYRNKWSLFQAKYTLIMGKVLPIRVKPLSIKIIIVFLLSGSGGVSFGFLKFLNYSPYELWETSIIMAFNLYTIISMGLIYGYWCLVMKALKQVSLTLNADIKGFAQKQSKIPLSSHEELWLDFSRLTRASGASVSYAVSVIIIFTFLMLTLSSYSTIASMNEEDSDLFSSIGMAFYSCYNLVLLIIFGNVAENVVKSAGEDYQNVLLDLKSTMLTDDTKKSLDRFLHVIASTPPVIDLGGFVLVNKSLNTSLLSSLVTYLIVLLQFRFTSSGKQS